MVQSWPLFPYICTQPYLKLHWQSLNKQYHSLHQNHIIVVYYLTFIWLLRPSTLFCRTSITHVTTSVSQRINILSIKFKIMTELFLNNVTHPVIWEGWHFTHIWEKHNECIISLKGEALVHITSLTATFYWSDCTKPGERVVLYVCVRGIHFACFYNFPDCIFELIWQCGNSCFSFYCTKKLQ